MRSVCLIAGGMSERYWRLQPWRYLTEVAHQLAVLGHPVTLLTDGEDGFPDEILKTGVVVRRISSVRNPVLKPNRELQGTIRQIDPDLLIWHLGLTSMLYQSPPSYFTIPIVGILSSPIYPFRELARLGTGKLLKGYQLSGVHLAGSLVPNWLLSGFDPKNMIDGMVVQTNTTRKALEQAGIWSKPIYVIPPGIDECWSYFDRQKLPAVRKSWGFNQEDLILLYYGSPTELRGLHTLLRALAIARRDLNNLKLVILSRRRPDERACEDRVLRRLLRDPRLEPHVKVLSSFLTPDDLVLQAAAADIITLPFELLPSDAPLSILEALALGKPIVTTRIACLPELVSNGQGYLAEPGDPNSLAMAIEQATEGSLAEQVLMPEGCSSRSWREVGEEWSQYLQSL